MSAADTFAPMIVDVATELLGKPEHTNGAKTELRWRNRGSLAVDAQGTWFDHEAKEGGGTLDLVMRECGCDKAGALSWLENKGFLEKRQPQEPTRYPYRDAEGRILYAKARVDKPDRKYEYQHPSGDEWRAGRGGIGSVPYRLPELLAAPREATLYMTEGEKKADKLASWGLLATAHGAWQASFGEYVSGRTVIILPDNDQSGEKQAAQAAKMVREAGGKPFLVRLPGLPPKGDVMDWNGTRRDLDALVQDALAGKSGEGPKPAFQRGISAAALMAKHFEPVNYVVPGLIAEGAFIFGGKPKIGKSWMAYQIAIALASGRALFGTIPVALGDVLYLALEDNERRLKSRLLTMGIRQPPERLTLATEWPDLDNGCIDELEAWADAVARPTLVIIDVLKMVRGQSRQGEQLYESDYRAVTGLGRFARERGLAVVLVHHVRKMESDDPLESLSGTNGLTGAADGVIVLKRDIGTGNCNLYVRGRDIEESETAVRFQADIGTWERLGAADEVGRTNERQAILDVVNASDKPLSAREISDLLGKSYDAVRKTMTRMAHAGELSKEGRGMYACPKRPNVPSATQPDNGTGGTGDESEEDWIGESRAQTRARLAGAK